jgi:hypothetical protein
VKLPISASDSSRQCRTDFPQLSRADFSQPWQAGLLAAALAFDEVR